MEERYVGYKNIKLSEEEMALFYTTPELLNLDILENEYLILQNDKGEVVDKYCYQNGIYRPLKYRKVSSSHAGDFKSKNL